jgi:predicted transcriptional regulator
MRTLIDIPNAQVRALAELCDKVNQPRAAIVREAIAEYLAKYHRGPGEDAFGLWTAAAPDGVDFQRDARAEW